MTDLSPAAQAVLDAMHEVNLDFGGENAELAAAALKAVALYCKRDSGILLSLADELERAND